MADITQHPNPLDENPLVIKNPPAPVKLTDADKENFFRFFMRDEPYSETVRLFDGKFTIVFKGLTIADQEHIYNQMLNDDQGDTPTSQAAYLNKIQLYRLALSIVSINGVPFGEDVIVTEDDKKNGVFRVKKLISLFDKWSVAKLFIINKAYVSFERKVEALVEEIKDPSF